MMPKLSDRRFLYTVLTIILAIITFMLTFTQKIGIIERLSQSQGFCWANNCKNLAAVGSSSFYLSNQSNTLEIVPAKPEPLLESCDDFQAYVDIHGYSFSVCHGRLGNQIGVMALGTPIKSLINSCKLLTLSTITDFFHC